MNAYSIASILIFMIALLALAWPLGNRIARLFVPDAPAAFTRLESWVYAGLYKTCRIKSDEEMSWQKYAASVIMFSVVGFVFLYALQRLQGVLPANPANLTGVDPYVALNTSVSFVTNTNWQAYAGESTMSFLTQMLGLTVQNFLSASVGMAVLFALLRGITRQEGNSVGNFWVDVTRSTIYVFLPLSLVLALFLVSQGVVQTLQAEVVAHGIRHTIEQHISLGPVASQLAIKQLGTNGGGFYNVNSAHPFENPTILSNLVELMAILLIPAALCFSYGAFVKDKRQGWALFAAMSILFVPLFLLCAAAEQNATPLLKQHADTVASAWQAGGNMEGKEARFGVVDSALWATATTAASNGSVNAMHDSFTPIGGLVPMWLMQLGEVIFGGVGSGTYGMFLYVVVAVFLAGLMIGRTPEYLGKKIDVFEMKMAVLAILLPSASVLLGTAIACILPEGTGVLGNTGAHGFSEILYAFSSGANNNGSAFGGLTASGPFYATAIALCMIIGRFGVILPVLAIAGSLARKKIVPPSSGTLATHTVLFVFLLAATVVFIGALTFIPALALGPVVEHFLLGM